MKARTKDYPAGPVSAFGFEFVAYEWRNVPAGFEADAERHPYLEIQPEAEPVPAEEPAKPKPRKRRRRTIKKAEGE